MDISTSEKVISLYSFIKDLNKIRYKSINNISAYGDGIKILFDDGLIQVFRNGRAIGNCSIEEFTRQPSASFRRLHRYASSEE